MSSVTSEAATSLSFQTVASKPARPDPSQGNDSFGALVDSSMPADPGNDPTTSAAQQPPVSRPSDDRSGSQDQTATRNAAADRTANHDSANRDADAQQASDANANASADANAAATQQSRPTSGGSKDGPTKAGATKSSEKTTSGKTSTADPAASGQQGGGPSVITPNPVAVVMPVTIASTDVPAATPASGAHPAPLAIAAAAIAASSPPPAASAAASTQTNSDATAAAAAAVVAATAKTSTQVAASAAAATPVKQPGTPTDVTATADAALTASVAATAPVASKTTTQLKAPVTAPAKTAASGATNTKSGKTDPSATATPTATATATVPGNVEQPAAAGKQAGNDLVGDATGAPSTSATMAAVHDHSPLPGAEHAPADPSDAGAQTTGMIQPQLPSTAATAAPTAALSATAATNAPVPLSGLAIEIAATARAGKSHFEIRLDPADLGRIDVRIDVDRNGQVTSHLTVEKPETLSMLRQDAPQLQRALDDAGFKTGDGGLQFSLRDQSSSGQNSGNETGRNAQRLVISDEDTIPAAIAGRTYGRTLGSSSGVDIRV